MDRLDQIEQRLAEIEQRLGIAPPQPVQFFPAPALRLNTITNGGCHVCGIGADGKPMSYACPRHDCPGVAVCSLG